MGVISWFINIPKLLIGGLEPWNFMTFHIWGMSSSQLTHIFQRRWNHQPVEFCKNPGFYKQILADIDDLWFYYKNWFKDMVVFAFKVLMPSNMVILQSNKWDWCTKMIHVSFDCYKLGIYVYIYKIEEWWLVECGNTCLNRHCKNVHNRNTW